MALSPNPRAALRKTPTRRPKACATTSAAASANWKASARINSCSTATPNFAKWETFSREEDHIAGNSLHCSRARLPGALLLPPPALPLPGLYHFQREPRLPDRLGRNPRGSHPHRRHHRLRLALRRHHRGQSVRKHPARFRSLAEIKPGSAGGLCRRCLLPPTPRKSGLTSPSPARLQNGRNAPACRIEIELHPRFLRLIAVIRRIWL